MQDVLAICSATLPSWTHMLVREAKFLFPFPVRRAWFRATALGQSRALHALRAAAAAEGPAGGGDSTHRGDASTVGRLARQKACTTSIPLPHPPFELISSRHVIHHCGECTVLVAGCQTVPTAVWLCVCQGSSTFRQQPVVPGADHAFAQNVLRCCLYRSVARLLAASSSAETFGFSHRIEQYSIADVQYW